MSKIKEEYSDDELFTFAFYNIPPNSEKYFGMTTLEAVGELITRDIETEKLSILCGRPAALINKEIMKTLCIALLERDGITFSIACSMALKPPEELQDVILAKILSFREVTLVELLNFIYFGVMPQSYIAEKLKEYIQTTYSGPEILSYSLLIVRPEFGVEVLRCYGRLRRRPTQTFTDNVF